MKDTERAVADKATKVEVMRQIAENCAELAEAARNEAEQRRFERMRDAWKSLADNQAWLDGE